MEQSIKYIDESLKAHFLSLYCLTVSDSDVDPKELETLYQIGLEYGISKEEIQTIVLSPSSKPLLPNTIEEKVAYLYNLTRIACADGKVMQEEKELICKYVVKFGFPKENATAIVEYFLKNVTEGKIVNDILEELK